MENIKGKFKREILSDENIMLRKNDNFLGGRRIMKKLLALACFILVFCIGIANADPTGMVFTLIPTLFAGSIDFDNLHVASTAYGSVAGEGIPRLLAAYNNKIYFIVSEDGTANPSKVCRYNPSDGLSNTVNHSIVKETTGKFVTLRQIDSLLYFSDNLGHVYYYDGSTVTAMLGTPFTTSDYVSSIEKFKGLVYFATFTGNIFRYDGLTFEPVCEISEDREIRDMVAWQKDGYLYVSVGPHKVICCPPLGYVMRSSSGNADSWETVLGRNYYSMLFMPTADYLYTAVMDSAYRHGSTLRRSSEGTTFPVIYPSDGQYKRMWGSMYHNGIAYFFADDQMYGVGEIIVDDNGSVNRIANQNWVITQAVGLNDEVYALAASSPGEWQGDVYLITTVSEPLLAVEVDIKSGSCPNPLNVKSKGVLPVVVLGSADFDAFNIDPASIRLEGVAPVRSSYEDVATPVSNRADDCDCTTEGPDGYLDLVLKFDTQEIVAALGGVYDGDVFLLTITGEALDGTPIEGTDCVVIIAKK